MENFNKLILNKKYIIAFLLSSLSMFLVLTYSQQLSNGKYMIMIGDNAQIYVPVIIQFMRNLREGDNIFYSWTNGFGMNTSLMNGFSAYNPFNFIFFVFPKLDPAWFTAFVIIVKTGFAALSFELFAEKALKITKYYTVLFSLMYSMCSFQIDSNIINIIWLDALFMLPLVLLFVHKLVEEGKFFGLTISLSYLFFTNFYMGYIVGIATILYFILLLIFGNKKEKFSVIIFKFALAGVTAVLVSSFAWLPAAVFMMKNHANDSTSDYYLKANLLDFVSQFFVGKDTGTKGVLPDVYCGIFSLLLIPAFFVCKSINKKIKIIYGSILCFYTLGLFVPFIYMFLHAFDAPDGWYFRFSFIVSFFVCIIACLCFEYIKEINKIVLIIGSICFVLINAIASYLQPLRFSFATFKPFLPSLIINIVITLIWVLTILYFDKLTKKDNKNAYILLTFFVAAECILNGFLSFYNNEQKQFNEEHYNAWKQSVSMTNEQLPENDLYRVEYLNDIYMNTDTFAGFNGISDFNTAENPNLRYTLSKLGIYTSPRVIRNFGGTSFTNLIFGVRYTVKGILPYAMNYKELLPYVRENDSLGFGFVVNEDLKKVKFTDNPFENNNILASSMSGENIIIFNEIPSEDVIIESNGIDVYKLDDGRILFEDTSMNDDGSVDFIIDDDLYVNDVYMYLDNAESMIVKKSLIYADGYENAYDVEGFTSVSYLKKFEQYENIRYVEIYSNIIKEQVADGYLFAEINEDEVSKVYNLLKNNMLNIDKFGNGYIEGNVNTEKEKSLMFTSIPLDYGWEIYVDGIRTDIVPLLDQAFIGFDISGKGQHDIIMRYKVAGLKLSITLSIAGLLLLIGLGLYERKFIK
ncbi:MAG: YfhO family protein [Bacteroidales bacterium]|nr:YfhO family protein [Bacteroidales bacterium]